MSTPTFLIFFENHYTLFGALSLKDFHVYYSASDIAKIILDGTWSLANLLGFLDLREILLPEEPLNLAPCPLIEESRLLTFLSSYTKGPGKDLYHFLTRGPMEDVLQIGNVHHLLEKSEKTNSLFSDWIERLRKEHDPSSNNPSRSEVRETTPALPVPCVPPKPRGGSMCGYPFYKFPPS